MKRITQSVLIGAASTIVALLLWVSGSLDRFEHATWAWRVHHFARPGPATDRIKLILLDQTSLEWGQKENGLSWPWPREVYAPIIDFCRRSGARALVFDVLYLEPSVYGVSDDQALGDAIKRGPPFVAALCLRRGTGSVTAWPPEYESRSRLLLEGLDRWMAQSGTADLVVPKAAFPITEVASSAALLGDVIDEPDLDGIFRRARLFQVFDRKVTPSLGFAAFISEHLNRSSHLATSAQRMDLAGKIEARHLVAGGRTIPIDSGARMILRFRGPAGTFESFDAASIIKSELLLQSGQSPPPVSPQVFKDCYVFFGFSAPGLLDLRPTPISKIYPGVEIHATVLDNVLSSDFIADTPTFSVVLATLFLALAGSFAAMVVSRRAAHSAIACTVLGPLPVVVGFAAYPLGYWWPIAASESAVALSLVSAILLSYATEGRRKAFIKNAFKHYLSPAVIERILEDPSQLRLGGERREMTILFSDLEGFSSISERLDPEALTSLLNDYLSDMTDIILEEGGTLDKYEGDAIIAFWNAPSTQPDHAERACRAAVRCQRKLADRAEEFARRAGRALRARIGINTGELVVGNMGSRTRFDYTVLGDAANLASRLEGANKVFGTAIMISEETWTQSSSQFAGRELGLIRVVGRTTPVRVYELTGLSGEEPPSTAPFLDGLAFCYEKRWAEALVAFEAIPEDKVAQLYARRCRELVDGRETSWDGIWSLTEK